MFSTSTSPFVVVGGVTMRLWAADLYRIDLATKAVELIFDGSDRGLTGNLDAASTGSTDGEFSVSRGDNPVGPAGEFVPSGSDVLEFGQSTADPGATPDAEDDSIDLEDRPMQKTKPRPGRRTR